MAERDSLRIIGPVDTAPISLPDTRVIRWGRDGLSLYAVAGIDSSSLYEIRRGDGAVIQEFPLTSGPPTDMLIDARASTLYLGTGPHMQVFALAPMQHRYSTRVCDDQITSAALFEPGTKLFVACRGDVLVVFDIALQRVLRRQPLPSACSPTSVFMSANETIVFLVCGQTGIAYLLDRVTLAPLDSLETGRSIDEVVADVARRRAVFIGPSGTAEYWDLRQKNRTALDGLGSIQTAAAAADGSLILAPATGFPLHVVQSDGSAATVEGPRFEGLDAFALWPTDTPVMRWLAVASPTLEPTQPRRGQ